MEIIDICRMVARSLTAEIGPWGNHCAFFGGLVPGLLIPEPEEPLLPHIGTRDVDLAIRIAAVGEDADMYRTLKQNLATLNLQQTADRSFEWRRTIEGFDVVVELFVPVADKAQGGKIQRKPIDNSGSGLTALGIYGLELINRDICEVEDEGPLLDGKGIKKVVLRVCGPAVLVALKASALKERSKTKDGYDVVWLLKAYGADVVANRFREVGLHQTTFGEEALHILEECFSTTEHTGAVGWVMESRFEGEERALELRDAVGVVREFVSLARGN